ncbi:hypothetical protein [Candidatus Erwinia haradaeae]|uniref:Autotransporter beta-domain superfamily protein n=1 Tax=Candidatus Erwinia haradaeae TaxID=1922217 RepID=A0A451D3I2_9GAMM|nr:hypothetical protein [Candidatus Erwinia haradaeae]VFP80216.1 Autotransporter beta-domain superfamily protein [Candidatus Erwinia haradaeae]
MKGFKISMSLYDRKINYIFFCLLFIISFIKQAGAKPVEDSHLKSAVNSHLKSAVNSHLKSVESSSLKNAVDKTSDIKAPLSYKEENTSIFCISSNGKVVGGLSYINADEESGARATIWSGPNWSTKTTLKTLKGDYEGHSKVISLSADGKIAAGYSPFDKDVMHAVIWSGDNWGTLTNLEKLDPDDVNVSIAQSLSGDGKIAGGFFVSKKFNNKSHAMIWSGKNWANKTDLGIINVDHPINSEVSVISADGKVASGSFSSQIGDTHAVIWSGENWSTKNYLDHSSSNNIILSESSEVSSLSADGKIAGGFYASQDKIHRATIWYGEKWSNKVDLGTLRKDLSGFSEVFTLSDDGKMAGGESSIDGNDAATHATIWYGEKWANKIDVGTLKSDFSGKAEILGFAHDGTSAIGKSISDDLKEHPFFIRLPRQETQVSTNTALLKSETSHSSEPATNTSFKTSSSLMVDLTNTNSTLDEIASDTFSLIKSQQHILTNLQQGCVANGNSLCWLINTKPSTVMSKDVLPTVNIGYGLTDVFSFGGVITRPLQSYLPKSHKINGNNVGAGVYIDWHASQRFGELYFRPAISFSQYEIDILRPTLPHSENGEGNSALHGVSSSLEWGGGYPIFSKNISWFWHTGVRYNQLSRDAYKEDCKISLPVSYNKISYDNIRGDIGTDIRVSILKPLILVSGVKIERMLKESALISDVDINGLFIHRSRNDLSKNSSIVKTGIVYALNKNLSLSMLESITSCNEFHKKWRLNLILSGTF